MADDDVVLRIAADVREALKALDDLRTGVRAVRAPAEEAADGLGNLFYKMTGAVTVGELLTHSIESAARAVFDFGKGAVDAGARLQQLAGVAEYLGNRAGYSSPFLKDLADKMQATGITGREAYDAMIQLTRANIDLEQTTKLQAAAQNSASIAGKSSSETFGLLIRGITTLTPELIRSAGYTTNLEGVMRQWKETTGGVTSSLSGAQKQQLLLNGVLAEADQITGVYGKSMEFAAKQQTSLTRVIEQLQERLGLALIPMTSEITELFLHWAEGIRDIDFTLLNEGAQALAGFIGSVVDELIKPNGLLVSLGRLGAEVGRDAVAATASIGDEIHKLLVSLHLVKEGEETTFTSFWIEKIRATTKEIQFITGAVERLAGWMRLNHESGGIIGSILGNDPDIIRLKGLWASMTGGAEFVLPKVESAFKSLDTNAYKPGVDTTKLLASGNKDLLAGLSELDKQSSGYVRGSGLIVPEVHKQSAKEAKAAAKAAADYADSMYALNTAASGTQSVIESMDGEVHEGIKYYLQQGVAAKDLVRVYGVTEEQVKAVTTEIKLQKIAMDAWKKVTDDTKDIGKLHNEVLYQEDELLAKGLNPDLTLVLQNYEQFKLKVPEVKDGHKKIADALVFEKDASKQLDESLGQLSNAFMQLAQISGSSFGGTAKAIGTTIAAVQLGSKAADGLKSSWQGFGDSWKQTVTDVDTGTTSVKTNWGGVASSAIGVAANVGGMVGAMQEATNHGTATANVLGGMVTGMKMGAQIAGPWGAAVGAAVGAIWGAFKGKPEWSKIETDITRDFGVHISDTLAKLIEEESKKTGNRVAAILNHLSDVIKEAGGITVKNVDMFTAKTHDLFSMLETHALTTEQVTKQLNEVFPQLAKQVIESNQLAGKSFTDLIELDRKFGTESLAVASFVKSNIENLIIPGLNTYFQVHTETTNAMSKSGRDLAQLQADLAAATTSKQREELKLQIAQVQMTYDQQKAAMLGLNISTQEAATGLTAAVVASFNELRRQGMSAGDAIAKMKPTIDNLGTQLEEAGFTGSEAFDEIRAMANLSADALVKNSLTAVDGLTNAMRGLHNSGLMDQTMFTGLSSQVTTTFNNLVAQGKDGTTVMRLMQPTLQMLWEEQNKFGRSVDDATANMLDEAHASGIVGSQYMSAQDKMAAATDRMVGALEGIARKLGVDIPAAADTMAVKTGAAVGRMNTQIIGSVGAFDQWAGRAVSAAERVRREVDGISFGESPGGIKEWIPMLRGAGSAFGSFGNSTAEQLRRVRDGIDAISGIGGPGDLSVAGRVVGGIGGGIVQHIDARGAVFEEEATVQRMAYRMGNKIAEQHYRNVKASITAG